jgi:hypothetical protein
MPYGAHKLRGWFAELRRRKVFRGAAPAALRGDPRFESILDRLRSATGGESS